MDDVNTTEIKINQVKVCSPSEMRALYSVGGWLDDSMDDQYMMEVANKSFAFVVAEGPGGQLIGMGRIISDGCSDAYFQDVVVLPDWQGKGVGSKIVNMLLKICKMHGIGWIGIIAGPGTEYFYRKFGFTKMGGYMPMLYEKV